MGLVVFECELSQTSGLPSLPSFLKYLNQEKRKENIEVLPIINFPSK